MNSLRCLRRLHLRLPAAPGTAVARQGRRCAQPELIHELPKTRIVGPREVQLVAPGSGDHGRVQARVGANQHVLLLGQTAQNLDLIRRQVGAVGEVDAMNWACTVCGYSIEGVLPETCPDCGADKEEFENVPIPGM